MHVEAGGTIKGMGLLPMDTVFAEKKTRTRVPAAFLELSGVFAPLRNVESRAMRSIWEKYLKKEAVAQFHAKIQTASAEEKQKTVHSAGNVCGTYVHGVFDKEACCRGLIIRVSARKKVLMCQI